ncbi:unnamed protein product [Protopolystoma xenopodis]|uniref:Uncharacterized protein n=1 Tax=Protopolystoma xenopodis TaxID=117903 RepID=A0A448XD75_9PLAT|nr:unnamed protein product [Protopolystoma xenopodis]
MHCENITRQELLCEPTLRGVTICSDPHSASSTVAMVCRELLFKMHSAFLANRKHLSKCHPLVYKYALTSIVSLGSDGLVSSQAYHFRLVGPEVKT